MRSLLLITVGLLLVGTVSSAAELSRVACPPGSVPELRTDEYVLDNGTGEDSVGLTSGGTLFWYNRFNVIEGFENIVSVSVAWGQIAAGRAAQIMIFSDPNNDGNAGDVSAADLLWSTPTTSQGNNTDTSIPYPVPTINVGTAGDVFFVGVCCNHDPGEHPARLDQDSTQGQSWIGGDGAQNADCADPNSGSLGALAIIDSYGLPGNWMIRASGQNESPAQTASWSSIKAIYR